MFLILGFTGFFQAIECVQVLFLQCVIDQTVATVLNLITQVLLLAAEVMVVGEIMVDIETTHHRMVAEGMVLGSMEEVLMGLDMVQVPLEVKLCPEIIQMFAQEKEIGIALSKFLLTLHLVYSCTPFFLYYFQNFKKVLSSTEISK